MHVNVVYYIILHNGIHGSLVCKHVFGIYMLNCSTFVSSEKSQEWFIGVLYTSCVLAFKFCSWFSFLHFIFAFRSCQLNSASVKVGSP